MSNDLTTTDAKLAFATQLSQSAMLPQHLRGKPNDLLWSIAMAEAMGVPAMTAIVGIHSIQGKPVASADLMAAVVRRAGHKLRIPISTDRECLAIVVRSDDPDYPFESHFTWDRATQAKLTGKENWRLYPAAMLRARAIAEVCRMACPEALLGVYTPDEMGSVDASATVVASTPAGNAATIAANIGRVALPAPETPRQAPQAGETGNDPPAPVPAVETAGWRDKADQRWFMGEVTQGLGLDYDDLAAWCESIGRPRPSAMTPTQRKKLLEAIGDPQGKAGLQLQAWLAARHEAQSAPAVEPQPVGEDDRPFFDEPGE